MSETATQQGPDYDVEIDADELLADLVELSQKYAREYAEHDRMWRESLDTFEPFHDAKYWALEDLGGRDAIAQAILGLQPAGDAYFAGRYRREDGTVDVREFMRWLSQRAEYAHEDSYGPYTETRQASESETAYVKVISLLRDDYGVGWPRLDDVGGNPLEADMP